jgi:riboflavin biosynthesis pyrimidine reductase
VTHALLGPGPLCDDLRAWRAARLGRREAARSAVLTSGRELDLDHPLLRGATRPLVITTPASAARLAPAAASRGIEFVGLDPLDPRSALAALRARGMRSIAIEAGPATALELYDAPLAIDELMLSIYEASALPDGVAGPPFLSPDRLAELLPRASRGSREGDWRFERRTR